MNKGIVSRLHRVDQTKLLERQLLTDLYPEGWPQFQSTVSMSLAIFNASEGLNEEANKLAESARAIIAPRDNVETPASIDCLTKLAFIKSLNGDVQEAITLGESSLTSAIAIYGEGHTVDFSRRELIKILLRTGEPTRALQLQEQVNEYDKNHRTVDDPQRLRNQMMFATAKGLAKNYDEALSLMNEIRPSFEVVFKNDSHQLFVFWHMLAAILVESRRFEQGIELRKSMCQYAAQNDRIDVKLVLDRAEKSIYVTHTQEASPMQSWVRIA